MLGADVVGCEKAQKRRSFGCSLYGRAAVGFFSLDNANNRGDLHARFLSGLNRINCGGAGSADVIDDDDTRAFAAESFDAAAGPVGLLRLADKKAIQERSAGIGLRTPSAGGGNVRDYRIGAHRETADGLGLDSVLLQEFEDGVAGESASFGMERSGAAVDVVVACAAGRELELAKLKANARENGEQL